MCCCGAGCRSEAYAARARPGRGVTFRGARPWSGPLVSPPQGFLRIPPDPSQEARCQIRPAKGRNGCTEIFPGATTTGGAGRIRSRSRPADEVNEDDAAHSCPALVGPVSRPGGPGCSAAPGRAPRRRRWGRRAPGGGRGRCGRWAAGATASPGPHTGRSLPGPAAYGPSGTSARPTTGEALGSAGGMRGEEAGAAPVLLTEVVEHGCLRRTWVAACADDDGFGQGRQQRAG